MGLFLYKPSVRQLPDILVAFRHPECVASTLAAFQTRLNPSVLQILYPISYFFLLKKLSYIYTLPYLHSTSSDSIFRNIHTSKAQ